jgi:uncharacterized membrane protein YqjE
MKQQKKRIYILGGCFLLTLLIAITFFPVTTYDYIGYDDSIYISDNPYVQTGFNKQSVYWALTSTHTSNWHPLTWLSYMLDNSLFGNHPGVYHWMNLNYHIINALLVFLFLTHTTGQILKSFIVAALFGIHPLHVESVAWISERKDVLSTCMILLSLYAYVRYVQQGRQKNYFLVFLFFLLSLMAKPMMVTFPFVLILIDLWPLSRKDQSIKSLILEKIPLLILSFIFCLITLWTQYSSGACQSIVTVSIQTRILNAFAAYGWYVTKFFVPINLAIFYPHPQTNVPLLYIIWGVLIISSGLWCSFRFQQSLPYVMTGVLWFLGTLIPVIGLVQVGLQAYADRYSYIPLTGLFIVLTWGIFDLGAYVSHNNKKGEKWAAAILVSLILMNTYLCSLQVRTWKNGTSVFQHALLVVPDNFVAMTHLGSIPHLQKALELRPNYIPALYNLGTALINEGKLHEALPYLLKAEKLNAQHPNIYNNIGGIYYQLENYSLSLVYLQKALELNPNQASTKKNIHRLYEKMSKIKDRP